MTTDEMLADLVRRGDNRFEVWYWPKDGWRFAWYPRGGNRRVGAKGHDRDLAIRAVYGESLVCL